MGGGYKHGTVVVGSKVVLPNHRRNNSTSFESFTASCDDAWDSNIEDCCVKKMDDKVTVKTKEPIDAMKQTSFVSSSLQSSSFDSSIKSNQSVPHSKLSTTSTKSSQSHQQNNLSPPTSLGNHHQHNLVESTSNSHFTTPPLPLQTTFRKSVPGVASCLRSEDVPPTTPVVPEEDPKLTKFKKLVYHDEVTDMNQLRSMSWAGIPFEVRPMTWKLLLGYLPVMKSRRSQVVSCKRADYEQLVLRYYDNMPTNDEMWRQIHIDIPRMQPLISIFQQQTVQKMFERILYIWSIRHPASGYVQGMNDLVTPFFVTYLSEFIDGKSLNDVETFDVSTLTEETLRGVEADSFWSFSKLLDSIQDNYTFAQPGIQRLVNLLSRVMSRVDANLHEHLMRNSVQYLQFAFRWMNNLLIRELPLRCIVRLWDTYLSEGAVSTTNSSTSVSSGSISASGDNSTSVAEGDSETMQNHSMIPYDPNPWSVANGTPFSCSFHLFVCAAFLRFWSKNLMREQDFQGLILLLQNLPTFHWTEAEIKLMVADAYQLKYTFTPNHLNS